MTLEQAKIAAPIVKAFADGKTVEREDSVIQGKWIEVAILYENLLYDGCYRIKRGIRKSRKK